MNFLDYTLIFLVGLSIVLSLWRGFVREIISIVGLVAAFLIASRVSAEVGSILSDWIPNRTMANIAGFALVFVIIMVVVGIIGAVIRKLVDMAALTATDRTLGMFFGLARGVLLIALSALIYTSYTKPEQPWIKKSMLAPYAIEAGDLLGQAIPEGYPFSRRGDARLPSPQLPSVSEVVDMADKITEKDREALTDIIKDQMK